MPLERNDDGVTFGFGFDAGILLTNSSVDDDDFLEAILTP